MGQKHKDYIIKYNITLYVEQYNVFRFLSLRYTIARSV